MTSVWGPYVFPSKMDTTRTDPAHGKPTIGVAALHAYVVWAAGFTTMSLPILTVQLPNYIVV